MATLVTCGHNCHMWSHLSHVVMWSHLSHVVTLVTCGHTCHMWSHLSNVITSVTCSQTCHMWSNFSKETNVRTADKKVSSLYEAETRPTYRPARTQVKKQIWLILNESSLCLKVESVIHGHGHLCLREKYYERTGKQLMADFQEHAPGQTWRLTSRG